MKCKWIVASLLTLIFVSTACAPVPAVTPTLGITAVILETGGMTTAPTPSAVPTKVDVDIATTVPTKTLATTETPRTAFDPEVALMINQEGTTPHLTDEQGRSLYISIHDSQHSSTSACMDDCAVEWPPLKVTGIPVASEGVDPSLIGAFRREDGSTQATYNGWALYYYTRDTIPGTTYGHRYQGLWFLISPDGEPIRR